MTFTPIQDRAIRTLDKNILLNAGAGSGKTRVLVERYLHVLDQHPDWALNSLVAITFTQKAAAEMRDRVRRTLSERYEKYRYDEDLAARWATYLTAMDSARIDTIHGLCATILRANAAEAGIDPDFVVLDEIDAAILLDNVLGDVLRTLARGEHDPSTLAILELFEAYELRDVRDILKSFAVASVTLPPLPEDVIGGWRTMWQRAAVSIIDALKNNTAFWALTTWNEGAFPEGDKITEYWLTCHGLKKRIDDCTDIEAVIACLEPISKMNFQGGAFSAWGGREALKEAKALLEVVREQVRDILAQIGTPPGEIDETAAKYVPTWYAMISRMKAGYAEAKQTRAALDFDDLESRTRDLLVTHSHVRDRYRGTEFKHVLVDEFQDTNSTQWEIVRALADIDDPGRVFVVGDPKQSIYAFRGADVSVFERVREQFKGLVHGEELNMPQSFRTHAPLVGGFNYFFQNLLIRDQSSAVKLWQVEFGSAMEAFRVEPPAAVPPIEFMLLRTDQLPKRQGKTTDGRIWEAYAIAERIREIVEVECRMVYDRHKDCLRPIRYGDVALLFQAMGNAPLYERALKAAGLPYVTIAGRGYYDRQEVWDVLNLLRALHHPGDNLSLAAALRSPMFGLSDEALLDLRSMVDANGNRLILWTALQESIVYDADEAIFTNAQERPLVQWAATILNELRAIAGRVSIPELLRAAYERTGILAILTGLPDGDRRRGNLEKLLKIAESSGKSTLSAFTRYLTDLTQSEVREGEATLDAENAITLMTVHKSKGLEFPLVVLVDVSRKLDGDPDAAKVLLDPEMGLGCKLYSSTEKKYVDCYMTKRTSMLRKERDEAERKRLLYVAATRAQDYLIISGQVSEDRNTGLLKGTGWMQWLIDGYGLANAAEDGEIRTYDEWGKALIRLPEPPTELDAREAPVKLDSWMAGWDVPAKTPPLLYKIKVERDAPARAMSATQIADLGGALYGMPHDHREVFKQRWRRSVLYSAPGRIDFVSDQSDRASRRRLGELVHRVLQLRDPDDDPAVLRPLIDSFVWEEGIIDPTERERTVNMVLQQLIKVARSDVQGWIKSAKRLYRELPFVFKTEKRMIHGVMDVLIERDTGGWVVIDYKTNQIGRQPARSQLELHANRYVLQVGVYAAAVQQLVGEEPRTFIHYIQYGESVEIAPEIWKSALASLETHIGDLMGDDES